MLMPTKIVKPVDSILSISAYVLKLLQDGINEIDGLFEKLNKNYYKKVTIEQLLLCLNFLYITNRIEVKNEVIKLKF